MPMIDVAWPKEMPHATTYRMIREMLCQDGSLSLSIDFVTHEGAETVGVVISPYIPMTSYGYMEALNEGNKYIERQVTHLVALTMLDVAAVLGKPIAMSGGTALFKGPFPRSTGPFALEPG